MRLAKNIIAELDQRDLLGVANAYAAMYDVVTEDLCTQTSPRSSVEMHAAARSARYMFWLHLVDRCSFTYPRIGALFGVHHTTVLYGVRIARCQPGKPQRKVA